MHLKSGPDSDVQPEYEVEKGMIERKRKKIEMEKAKEVVARFNEVPNPILTARQFVIMHFDELQQSGKPLEALHQFLLANGIDVGPFESFRTVYNSVKRARKNNSIEPVPPKRSIEPEQATPMKADPVETLSSEKIPELEKATSAQVEKTQETDAEKEKKRGLGLRPIYSADGRELEIDPNTGAKTFKV